MRASAVVGTGSDVRVEELELLELRPHDVLVRVEASNVGIADTFSGPESGDPGLSAPPLPPGGPGGPGGSGGPGGPPPPGFGPGLPPTVVHGHAGVGVVEATGSAVERVHVGDRVLMTSTPNCGACFYCLRGRPDICAELVPVGPAFARLLDGTEVHANSGVGSFAEVAVVPDIQLVVVATDLPADQLSLIANPVATGVGAALRSAPIAPGSVVAVLGCGPVGLSYVQGARLAAAGQIIAIDPLAHRREAALRFGATAVVDPAEVDPVETVRELAGDAGGAMFGRGADYVLEAAGPVSAVEQAWAMARSMGHVTVAGACEPLGGTVTLPATELVIAGKTLHSCQQGSLLMRRDLPWLVELAERGRLDVAGMAERSYSLKEVQDATRDVADRTVIGATLLPKA